MDSLEDSKLVDVPVVVIDTETTGLNPAIGHRLIEIAAVKLNYSPRLGWQLIDQFTQLINPGRSVDLAASRINGIFDEDLVGKPIFQEIAGNVLNLLDKALLVAHNAEFDASFLSMEFHILNMRSPGLPNQHIYNPWLCTMMLSRRNFYFGRNSLGHVARMLGVRTGRAHRALGDVFTTAEVFKRMVREFGDPREVYVGDLFLAQGGPIYSPMYPVVDLYSPIDEAIKSGTPLQVLYDGPQGEIIHTVLPLYATEFQGKQYLITYSPPHDDQCTLRVDRILSAEFAEEEDR